MNDQRHVLGTQFCGFLHILDLTKIPDLFSKDHGATVLALHVALQPGLHATTIDSSWVDMAIGDIGS